MSRLPEFDEARFDARQKTIYDEIIAARGHLGGPFKIWLYSPELADRNQRLGAFLRYHTSLETRLSELAILVVGRHFDCQVEWTLHEGFAREAGLEDEIDETPQITGQRLELQSLDSRGVFAGEVLCDLVGGVEAKNVRDLLGRESGCHVEIGAGRDRDQELHLVEARRLLE